jgi:hypothetical protein
MEQLGFFVQLGLGLEDAVLACLVVESGAVFAVCPDTLWLETLVGSMVSVMLPPLARPAPPVWSLRGRHRLVGSRHWLTLPGYRLHYAWGRVRTQVEPFEGAQRRVFKARLRRWAKALEPWRALVTAQVRALRPDEYRMARGEMQVGGGTGMVGLLAWEACCPGIRLDYQRQYTTHRGFVSRTQPL